MSKLLNAARFSIRAFANKHMGMKRPLHAAETWFDLARHTVGQAIPQLIQASTRKLTVAITAYCNLRCIGCRYGRDFMPERQLSLPMVEELLEDAKAAGIETVRLYGGEPLLHSDLPTMVRHATDLGLSTLVTTNGLLLKQKIDRLYEAGLRNITLGFYGTAEKYDRYVQRDGGYRQLEESVAAVRNRYGSSVSMQLNYLLMRQSCNLDALYSAWEFAERHDLTITIDLIHYSLPYFTDGPNHELQFREGDLFAIMEWLTEFKKLKMTHPVRIKESVLSINSIPDWLLRGPRMQIPCDAYKMIWVGADGTVQLCYAAFKLGNLHEHRLREMLFTDAHCRAARNAFTLMCPNCHCERETRILKHLQSRFRYSPRITAAHYASASNNS